MYPYYYGKKYTYENKQWYLLDTQQVYELLGTKPRFGLTNQEAKLRLEKLGKNELTQKKKRSAVLRFLAHFNDTLIYVLLVAAIVTAALGHYVDTTVIVIVAVVNAMIGFFQESKAEKALDNIRKMLSFKAQGVRDGIRFEINADELTVGDLVLLESGDKAPADLRLVRASNLKMEEAALTGESVPSSCSCSTVGKTGTARPVSNCSGGYCDYSGCTSTPKPCPSCSGSSSDSRSCGTCGTQYRYRSCDCGTWGSWGSWGSCQGDYNCWTPTPSTPDPWTPTPSTPRPSTPTPSTPDPSTPKPCPSCSGSDTESQDCNGCGTKTRSRSCNCGTWGSWSSWSSCSKTAAECKTPEPTCPSAPASMQSCRDCGRQTRSITCNASTGYKWQTGSWSACKGVAGSYMEVFCCGKSVGRRLCHPSSATWDNQLHCKASCDRREVIGGLAIRD